MSETRDSLTLMKILADRGTLAVGAITVLVGATGVGVHDIDRYGRFGVEVGIVVLGAWGIAATRMHDDAVDERWESENLESVRKRVRGELDAALREFTRFALEARGGIGSRTEPEQALLAQFADLSAQVGAASKISELEEIAVQVEAMDDSYLLVASEAQLAALQFRTLTDFEEWGVPAATRTALATQLASDKATNSLHVRRIWARELLVQSEDWSEYVTWFNGALARSTVMLVAIMLAFLAEGVVLVMRQVVILGVLSFAASGAIVSFLLSLPRVLTYDEWNKWVINVIGRVATGVMGAFAAMGLLVTKTISIDVGSQPVDEIIGRCATNGCSSSQIFTFGAIAMLLGFTERLFPTLDTRLWKTSAAAAPNSAATAGDKAGAGG